MAFEAVGCAGVFLEPFVGFRKGFACNRILLWHVLGLTSIVHFCQYSVNGVDKLIAHLLSFTFGDVSLCELVNSATKDAVDKSTLVHMQNLCFEGTVKLFVIASSDVPGVA